MADDLTPNSPLCSQCGYHHPPLKEGENCPMAPQRDNRGNEIDISDEVVQVKNMLIANIQKKGITDHKKFVRNMLLKLQQHMDEYSEE